MNQEYPKRLRAIAGILILCAAIFAGGYYAGAANRPAIDEAVTLRNKTDGAPAGVDFAPFWKAWNILNEKFVPTVSTTTVSDQDRVYGAIEGLAASFKDPYTVFFPPQENSFFQSEIQGNFDGVGMEIGIKDGILTVISPLKGTPAAKAGILPGDKIVKIDDTITNNMQTDQAIQMIRGPKGTAVRLTLVRRGRKDPFEVKVVRDTIEVPTVDTELKPLAGTEGGTGLQSNGIFVIRLYTFTASSADLFRAALRKFIESGSDKLIIDLRGNPGGYLEAAVDMASWFLPMGDPVVTEDFGKSQAPIVYRSKGYDVFNKNLKMVILVNGGSASASEILAGALKEYGIATLVGTTTFGKGSVQELVDITPDTTLKVTVARWLTPHGLSISEKGITPDVSVDLTPDDLNKGKDPQMDAAVKILTTGRE